jgi:hypothetical protein
LGNVHLEPDDTGRVGGIGLDEWRATFGITPPSQLGTGWSLSEGRRDRRGNQDQDACDSSET